MPHADLYSRILYVMICTNCCVGKPVWPDCDCSSVSLCILQGLSHSLCPYIPGNFSGYTTLTSRMSLASATMVIVELVTYACTCVYTCITHALVVHVLLVCLLCMYTLYILLYIPTCIHTYIHILHIVRHASTSRVVSLLNVAA